MPLIYKPYQGEYRQQSGTETVLPPPREILENGQHAEDGGTDRREGFSDTGWCPQRDSKLDVRDAWAVANSRTVRLEGLGTFTMIAKAGGKGSRVGK